jgi:GNAT superfamily N-acetyltransferase
MIAHWRAMAATDLAQVEAIAEEVHPAFPESPSVPHERLTLFPAGCFVAERATVEGYAIAHPWILGRPPRLDTLLGRLPPGADCLYLHDVALLPRARGLGLPSALLARLRGVAAELGLRRLALVAVNRSTDYWMRHGFRPAGASEPGLADKLASYGPDAAYLVAEA